MNEILTPERTDRFWSKVDVRSPDECWEWAGERMVSGYGVYCEWANNRRWLRITAHRLSLLIAGQEIADRVVRHDCDNPPCVNPQHLRVRTQADNIRDAIGRGRLNAAGLALGQAAVWPPRPCTRGGMTVSSGRKRLCEQCRREAGREALKRYAAKQRGGYAA